MAIIDAHTHIGQSVYNESQDTTTLLRHMDQHAVERSIVTAFTPPDLDFARANREVVEAVKAHPDRLIGSLRIDPRLTEPGKQAIQRAAERDGFRWLVLHPVEQGFAVNHPVVLPVIECAQAYRMIIHIATGTPVLSTPMQVADLARQFPDTVFILGHMGGDAYFGDAMQAVKLYPNLYLDSAGHVLTGEAKNGLHLAIDAAGVERVMFASDSPHFDLGIELLRIEIANLPRRSRELILSGNCLRLLEETSWK